MRKPYFIAKNSWGVWGVYGIGTSNMENRYFSRKRDAKKLRNRLNREWVRFQIKDKNSDIPF